jgi:hypothetical protein
MLILALKSSSPLKCPGRRIAVEIKSFVGASSMILKKRSDNT